MKAKKVLLASGLILAGGIVATGLALHQSHIERQKAAILESVRSVFETLGSLQVLYINDFESSDVFMTGGVVLEDGRVFHFTYDLGQLDYQQEN